MNKCNNLKFLEDESVNNKQCISAFIKNKENKSLILIDCGKDVFHKLLSFKLLEDVERVDVILTHIDHIDSLDDLVFYSYYIRRTAVNVYFPNEEIRKSLSSLNVNKRFYDLIKSDTFKIDDYKFTRTTQVDKAEQSIYGYYIENDKSKIFFNRNIDEEVTPVKVIDLFSYMRNFAKEETKEYEQYLEKLSKPTEENFFDLI